MLRSLIHNFFSRKSVFITSLFIFVFFSQLCCYYFEELRERRNKAETDLDFVCKNIPIPIDYIAVSSDKSLDIDKAVVTRRFKSKVSCELARNHFFTYFIDMGWNREQMEVEQSRGGMDSLDFIFRNDDYVIWIWCQNDVPDEAQKQIGISCSWGLRK